MDRHAGLGRFFFSSRRRHTRSLCDWSSDVCSSDLQEKTTEVENVEVEEVEKVESVDAIRMAMERGKRDSGVSLRIDAELSVFVAKIAGRRGPRTSRYLTWPLISSAPVHFSESAGQLFHDVFSEHSRRAEPDSFFHQL